MENGQDSVEEAGQEGHLEQSAHAESRSNADVAQTLRAPASLGSRDAVDNGTENLPVESQQQETVTITRTRDKKFLSPCVLSAVVAMVVLVFLAQRRSFVVEGGNPALAYPLPTDHRGLRKTLEVVEESANQMRREWDSCSPEVRNAFMKLYSPKLFIETFTEEQNLFWCDKYVEALKSQPIPGLMASKAERQEFALRNSLVTAIFRATAIRLEHLSELHELSRMHKIPSIFSVNPARSLLPPIKKDERRVVSFDEFTRRLEKLGVVGVAQEGDSHAKVSSVLAKDLGNATVVKMNYQDSSVAVVQEFRKFLASVKHAMIGRSTDETRRIVDMAMPDTEVPFSIELFTHAVKRAKTTEKSEHLSVSEIRDWRIEWSDETVSNLADDVRASQQAMLSFTLAIKLSTFDRFARLEDIDLLSAHLFTRAIALL